MFKSFLSFNHFHSFPRPVINHWAFWRSFPWWMMTENIWRVAQRIHSSLIVRSKTNGDSLFTVSCSVAFVTCRSLSYLHKIIESNHKSPTASICLMTFHNEAIWSINDSTSQASINVFLFIRTLLCLSKRTFELEHYSRFFWIKLFLFFFLLTMNAFFRYAGCDSENGLIAQPRRHQGRRWRLFWVFDSVESEALQDVVVPQRKFNDRQTLPCTSTLSTLEIEFSKKAKTFLLLAAVAFRECKARI